MNAPSDTLPALGQHIVVVDDDDRLRALLEEYLSEHGFFVSTACDTREAEELLRVFTTDVLVLDVMMPGEEGTAYAARLSPRADAPPVLLLTARSEVEQRIAGLESGAADYLTKPFAPRELLLRIENLLRRRTSAPDLAKLAFGPYQLQIETGLLTHNRVPVNLTSGERDCLRILARSAGTPVTREDMAAALGDVFNPRSVDVQINRLRKKIEPQPAKPIYLQTIRHAGYVLYADPC